MKKIKKLIFKSSDIQWILTVPAIWDETAKHQMRDWAKKAGLITNKKNPYKQCIIVLEPDCASLAVQNYVINKNKIRNQNKHNQNKQDYDYDFKFGDKYILVDVGGGTCDIACHQILTTNDVYGVKEIYHPSGGAYGASYIDNEFINMLQKIFTKQWIDEFKKEYSNYYVELIHKFRIAKESYFKEENKMKNNNNMHYVELPEEFVTFLDEKCELFESQYNEQEEIDPDDMFENAQINGSTKLLTLIRPQGSDNTYFVGVHDTVWKYLFDIIVIKIVDECRNILSHSQMKQCKYMILVGGLASNRYYQQRMKKTFGNKLKIIIPPNPIMSVVEGAARFAFEPNYIKGRVLSKHYGISASYSLESCKKVNIDDEFIENNKFKLNNGDIWVDNLFCPLVTKNQTIYFNKPIYYKFMTRTEKQKKVKIKLYCSDSDNVPLKIEDECVQTLCTVDPLSVYFNNNKKNMDLMIKLLFHDSMLRIFVYPKNDIGQMFNERELELEYEHY